MRLLGWCVGLLLLFGSAVHAQTPPRTLDDFERAVSADPENLKLAADYRQAVIGAAKFDRSIDFLETLSKRKGSGPNVQISLALAYVDKVPPSGDIRRLYLGRDAIAALTKSIQQRPSVLAYYVRGVIRLYFNRFIFKYIPQGIEDLQQALRLAVPETPATLLSRIHVSLGDGYWKTDQKEKAREAWMGGLARFPSDETLKSRMSGDDTSVSRLVTIALYASNRVDTTLTWMGP